MTKRTGCTWAGLLWACIGLAAHGQAAEPTTQPAAQAGLVGWERVVPANEIHVRFQEPVAGLSLRSGSGERGRRTVRPVRVEIDGTARLAVFSNLDPLVRYDVMLHLAGGGQIEGADLDVVGRRFVQVAAGAHVFGDEDEAMIREQILGVEEYEDQVRVLSVQGDGGDALALVEKIRTRPFHGSGAGEVIWRVEVWPFRWQYGGWVKLAAREQILVHERLPGARLQERVHVFEPQLGGLSVGSGGLARTVVMGTGPAAAMGRTAGGAIRWR